jgi:hypothetical protein
MKILIIGHKNHGKTTAAKFIADLVGLKYADSSWFCAERVVYPVLKDRYGYTSVEECYKDRDNHRAEWYELIAAVNADDPANLTNQILAENDIYCGLRNIREYEATWHLYDMILWIDASDTKPLESSSSMTLEFDPKRMIKILANGDDDELYDRIIFALQVW